MDIYQLENIDVKTLEPMLRSVDSSMININYIKKEKDIKGLSLRDGLYPEPERVWIGYKQDWGGFTGSAIISAPELLEKLNKSVSKVEM